MVSDLPLGTQGLFTNHRPCQKHNRKLSICLNGRYNSQDAQHHPWKSNALDRYPINHFSPPPWLRSVSSMIAHQGILTAPPKCAISTTKDKGSGSWEHQHLQVLLKMMHHHRPSKRPGIKEIQGNGNAGLYKKSVGVAHRVKQYLWKHGLNTFSVGTFLQTQWQHPLSSFSSLILAQDASIFCHPKGPMHVWIFLMTPGLLKG